MQSAWAIGYGAAALVTCSCCRGGAGAPSSSSAILPAFLTIWIRRRVEEPAIWRETRGAAGRAPRELSTDIFASGPPAAHRRR